MTHATVTKAVIPAAGLGTRFLPATKAQPKEMLPVVDKPAIQYVVEEAVRGGIDDILIITGRSKRASRTTSTATRARVTTSRQGQGPLLAEVLDLAELADIHYVRQGEPLGLGHAVSVARKHVGDNPFVVMLGDDIMDEHSTVLVEMIDAYERTGAAAVSRCMEVQIEEISAYGVDAYEDVGDRLVKVTSIVEKPSREDAPSNLAVMGRYVFTAGIFDAIDRIKPGVGGEIQLTDAIGACSPTRRVRLHLRRGPLRHRQQARLPQGHRRAGPRPRRPRPRVPRVPQRLRPNRHRLIPSSTASPGCVHAPPGASSRCSRLASTAARRVRRLGAC